jgi:hypothetical protein
MYAAIGMFGPMVGTSRLSFGGIVNFILSNRMIKIIIGVVAVMTAVYFNEKPNTDRPCVTLSNYPGRSEVFQCQPGLNSLYVYSKVKDTYTTVTTNPITEGWLTVPGDDETMKTIRARLGTSMGLGPGSFLSVDRGTGLVYIYSKTTFLVTVAWHESTN